MSPKTSNFLLHPSRREWRNLMETQSFPAQPGQAQRDWQGLGYGLFLHFGPNTFAEVGWGDGRFPASQFAPTALNPSQWAEMAAEAGMRYAVLIAKHHDGFCLWPSQHTRYSVSQSPGQPDVVGKFVEAFRRAGLKVGLY